MSPPFDERFQFLYFATIEGAHADGLTDAEVDRILLRNGGKGAFMHFIYACPICMPVLNGLLAYRTRPEFFGFKKMATHQSEHPTMGEGLSKELREELASDRQGVRLKAINALLTRWVDRRMEMLNLSPEQRKVWDKRFEDGRKEGMLMLENFRSQGSLKDLAPGFVDFKECAVCNAATKRSFMGPK
ncbi:MAG: hypothetical protein EBS05_15275 [Proteobacteria bacterium]|nr:hypothetical protein [Pseudomonadota bacterium]